MVIDPQAIEDGRKLSTLFKALPQVIDTLEKLNSLDQALGEREVAVAKLDEKRAEIEAYNARLKQENAELDAKVEATLAEARSQAKAIVDEADAQATQMNDVVYKEGEQARLALEADVALAQKKIAEAKALADVEFTRAQQEQVRYDTLVAKIQQLKESI